MESRDTAEVRRAPVQSGWSEWRKIWHYRSTKADVIPAPWRPQNLPPDYRIPKLLGGVLRGCRVVGRLLTNPLIEVGMVRSGSGSIPRGRRRDPPSLEWFGLLILIDQRTIRARHFPLQAPDPRLNLERRSLLLLFLLR